MQSGGPCATRLEAKGWLFLFPLLIHSVISTFYGIAPMSLCIHNFASQESWRNRADVEYETVRAETL